MDMISNYKNLVSSLERQELESAIHGGSSPQVYGQLLAIYLMMGELPNAKLLWKRIPSEIKENNAEIVAVWEVGKRLYLRDLPAVYQLVDDFNWPGHLKNIMNCIKESTRERMLNLISQAYTSIRLQEISRFIGLSESDTIGKIQSLNWNIDAANEFVTPVKSTQSFLDDTSPVSFDDLMSRLTEFVAFLEN